MRSTAGDERLRGRRRNGAAAKLARGAGVVLVAAAVAILVAPRAYANVATATMSPAPTVSVTHNPDGTIALSLQGAWTWPTLKGPSATHPCDSRFGAGWAMTWNDPNDHGTKLTYVSGSKLVRVDVGSTGVDPANADQKVTYDHAHPCGTFTQTNSPNPGDGTVAGTYTAQHVYAGVSAVPPSICVVMYDLTGNKNGPGPDPARLLFTNEDNSVHDSVQSSGSWDTTPGGPNCVAVSATQATPTLASTATGAAVGSPITDAATLSGTAAASGSHATGTITFDAFGPSDSACGAAPVFNHQVTVSGDGAYGPVSFTPTQGPGSYRWVASYSGDSLNQAVAGTCGQAAETSVVTSANSTTTTTAPPLTTAGTGTVASPPVAAASSASTSGGQLATTGSGPGLATTAATAFVLMALGVTLLTMGRRRPQALSPTTRGRE